MGNFAELGLKKEIVHHIASLGFTDALEVQKEIIPLAMQGKNIVKMFNLPRIP
jgi:superfamily II DNA/RNA helicase